MMQFDGLKLSRMEIVTSGVEAHQACAIVIMSPHGFSGSPYLPGKKSSSFKCVKNAYCGTICALIVDLISYQGLSAPQRRRRRRGRKKEEFLPVSKWKLSNEREGKINMSKG